MNTAPEAIYSLGSVDVNAVDPYTKRIGFNVHFTCLPHEMNEKKFKDIALVLADKKLNYLVDEGFIDSLVGWNMTMELIGHPPETN